MVGIVQTRNDFTLLVLIFLKRSVIKSQTKKVIMEPHKVFGLKLVFPIGNNLSTQFVKSKKRETKDLEIDFGRQKKVQLQKGSFYSTEVVKFK